MFDQIIELREVVLFVIFFYVMLQMKEIDNLVEREEQLELYIEEKQDFLMVGVDQFYSLRFVCSEEVFIVFSFFDRGFFIRILSFMVLFRGSEGDFFFVLIDFRRCYLIGLWRSLVIFCLKEVRLVWICFLVQTREVIIVNGNLMLKVKNQ